MKKLIFTLSFSILFFRLFSQWSPTAGPSSAGDIRSLLVSDSSLIAGSTIGGVFISTDTGVTWNASNNGLTNLNEVRSLVTDSTNIYAGIYNSLGGNAVFISGDGGASWSPSPLSFLFLFSMAWRPGLLIAGTWDGVAYSTNSGTSWSSSSTGLPSNASVCALAINGNKIFSGVCGSSSGGSGVFSSINSGASRSPFNSGLTSTTVYSLAVNGAYVFAGTDAGGIFRSSIASPSWSAVNTGLTNNTVRSLMTSGSSLFAGTDNGVFVSLNDGANWYDISAGLPPNAKIYDLATDDVFLYAGADTVVWKRRLTEIITGVQGGNEVVQKINIYPNPTNGDLYVNNLPVNERKTIQIYNILGENVFEKEVEENEADVKINIENLNPGVYYLQVTNNRSVHTAKLIIE